MRKIKKPLAIKIDFSKLDTKLLWHSACSTKDLLKKNSVRFVFFTNAKNAKIEKMPIGTVFFFDRYLEAFIFSQIHGGVIALDTFDDSFCVFTTLIYNKI